LLSEAPTVIGETGPNRSGLGQRKARQLGVRQKKKKKWMANSQKGGGRRGKEKTRRVFGNVWWQYTGGKSLGTTLRRCRGEKKRARTGDRRNRLGEPVRAKQMLKEVLNGRGGKKMIEPANKIRNWEQGEGESRTKRAGKKHPYFPGGMWGARGRGELGREEKNHVFIGGKRKRLAFAYLWERMAGGEKGKKGEKR